MNSFKRKCVRAAKKYQSKKKKQKKITKNKKRMSDYVTNLQERILVQYIVFNIPILLPFNKQTLPQTGSFTYLQSALQK